MVCMINWTMLNGHDDDAFADAQGAADNDDDLPFSCSFGLLSSQIQHPSTIVQRTTPAPTTTATTSAAVTSTTGLIGTTQFYSRLC